MKNEKDKILKKYLQGKCSKSEYLHITEMFENEPSKNLEEFMEKHWSNEKENQPLNHRMVNLLLRMQDKIIKKRPTPLQSIAISYQRIAAILLIPLILASLWMFFKPAPENETASACIVSPMGARVQFTLPDGTTGWLNNGSSLSYETNFTDRVVSLKGEAYFEVVKKRNLNFTVQTNNLSVKVLGTKFNISAYDDDLETSIILNEGSIKVTNEKGSISEILKPDEKFDFNRSESKASISKVNSADYISWKDGYLKFRGEALSKVAKKMERWYNIDIEITNKQLNDFKYRGTFKDEKLEEVLRLISLTTPLTYTINERKINAGGSYKKRKVIIKRN